MPAEGRGETRAGRLLYRLRHRWRDGTTHLLLDPLELVERLAVLVPPPRFHLVRYYGILAPRAAWRDKVTPSPPRPADRPGPERDSANESPGGPEPTDRRGARHSRGPRLPWADLLRRVFAVEALTCPRCGEPMRVLAAIQSLDAIRAILECLGLPARPPPIAPPAIAFLLPDELPES